MKITIEHLRVKREIVGNGFNICGSREDLLTVAKGIMAACETGTPFGWVQIRDPIEDEHRIANCPPLPWK